MPMGITNQQIADIIQRAVTELTDALRDLVGAQVQESAAYRELLERMLKHEQEEHATFRRELAEIHTKQQRMHDRQMVHDDNWKRVWGILVAVLIIPVGVAIVTLVVK